MSRNFGRKNNWSAIFYSKIFLILLAILVLIFAWNIFNFGLKVRETTKNKELVEQKVRQLEENKKKLEKNISRLKTDEGVEENIREKFGLAEEGEEMIMVVNEEKEPLIETPRNSFWDFLKKIFD